MINLKKLKNAVHHHYMLKVEIGKRIVYVTPLTVGIKFYDLQVYKESGSLRYGKWGHVSEWEIHVLSVMDILKIECERR
jgi:predicted P-loop ATPase/GTPase